jgi:hypothetical protein
MDFTPQDAIASALRIVRTPRVPAGAPAPPAQAPPPAPAVTIRTVGPADPPPFDRKIVSPFRRVLPVAVVLAIAAIVYLAVRP